MAEFLLELLSEEIPAGMQWQEGCRQLEAAVEVGLLGADVSFDDEFDKFINVYSTPRRLILHIEKLANTSERAIKERKGPRVDAPQYAIDGFCDSCGVNVEDLLIQEDKKGKFYVLQTEEEGREIEDILAEIIPEIIRDFSWSKSMVWGDGGLRWVRPLHSILAILDGSPIIFEIGGIKSGNTTFVRSTDTEPVSVRSFGGYCGILKDAGIIVSQDDREAIIDMEAKEECEKYGLHLIEDSDLLDEITGLVETPFCILGEIDRKFLDLPPEVLQTSMKTHQKFLSVANFDDKITHFITVANKHKPSKSAQETILAGNQKVLSARLADAKFFWENDLRIAKDLGKLKNETSEWEAQLEKITFHNKLGTQAERINRITQFAKIHADFFGVKCDIPAKKLPS